MAEAADTNRKRAIKAAEPLVLDFPERVTRKWCRQFTIKLEEGGLLWAHWLADMIYPVKRMCGYTLPDLSGVRLSSTVLRDTRLYRCDKCQDYKVVDYRPHVVSGVCINLCSKCHDDPDLVICALCGRMDSKEQRHPAENKGNKTEHDLYGSDTIRPHHPVHVCYHCHLQSPNLQALTPKYGKFIHAVVAT